jgi:hypothetical protein
MNERKTADGMRISEIKYSNCFLCIKNYIPDSVMMEDNGEGIKIHAPGRLIVPCFSVIHVKKFNPLIHTYTEIHGQKLTIPKYRQKDSTRYFQGVSLALIPGEISVSGNPFVSIDRVKNGFRDDRRIARDLNIAFFNFGLEKAIEHLDQGSEVVEVMPPMITEKFRDFFVNPPKPRIEYLVGQTFLPIKEYGQCLINPNEGFQIYQKRIADIEKKIGQVLPRNNFVFD